MQTPHRRRCNHHKTECIKLQDIIGAAATNTNNHHKQPTDIITWRAQTTSVALVAKA
jgi:PIN domain nuclease of toxin-antitoxin system